MPICQQCTNRFPARVLIDEKFADLHNRKYCLNCSPYGKRKKCGPKPQFKTDDNKICPICNKIHKEKKNITCSTCRSAISRKKKKEQAVEYKGGKCQICGYNKSIKALVFHHREPNTKSFTLAWMWGVSWEKIQPELEKCDLLCANCHHELHESLEQ